MTADGRLRPDQGHDPRSPRALSADVHAGRYPADGKPARGHGAGRAGRVRADRRGRAAHPGTTRGGRRPMKLGKKRFMAGLLLLVALALSAWPLAPAPTASAALPAETMPYPNLPPDWTLVELQQWW